jgi:hypothetical protein
VFLDGLGEALHGEQIAVMDPGAPGIEEAVGLRGAQFPEILERELHLVGLDGDASG